MSVLLRATHIMDARETAILNVANYNAACTTCYRLAIVVAGEDGQK